MFKDVGSQCLNRRNLHGHHLKVERNAAVRAPEMGTDHEEDVCEHVEVKGRAGRAGVQIVPERELHKAWHWTGWGGVGWGKNRRGGKANELGCRHKILPSKSAQGVPY